MSETELDNAAENVLGHNLNVLGELEREYPSLGDEGTALEWGLIRQELITYRDEMKSNTSCNSDVAELIAFAKKSEPMKDALKVNPRRLLQVWSMPQYRYALLLNSNPDSHYVLLTDSKWEVLPPGTKDRDKIMRENTVWGEGKLITVLRNVGVLEKGDSWKLTEDDIFIKKSYMNDVNELCHSYRFNKAGKLFSVNSDFTVSDFDALVCVGEMWKAMVETNG